MNGIGRPSRPGTIVVRRDFTEGGRARPDRAEALDGRRAEEDERRRARGGRKVSGPSVGADEERRARREAGGGGGRRGGGQEKRKRKRKRRKVQKTFRPALFAWSPAEHGLDSLRSQPCGESDDVPRCPFLIHLRRKRLQHRERT